MESRGTWQIGLKIGKVSLVFGFLQNLKVSVFMEMLNVFPNNSINTRKA
jgi:hypothetical protein